MIFRAEYGWTVALESDCDIGLRRFAGLTTARKYLNSLIAVGVIPEGRPFRIFFHGWPLSIPLRDKVSGREVYTRDEAETLAESQFPGLWHEVCN